MGDAENATASVTPEAIERALRIHLMTKDNFELEIVHRVVKFDADLFLYPDCDQQAHLLENELFDRGNPEDYFRGSMCERSDRLADILRGERAALLVCFQMDNEITLCSR